MNIRQILAHIGVSEIKVMLRSFSLVWIFFYVSYVHFEVEDLATFFQSSHGIFVLCSIRKRYDFCIKIIAFLINDDSQRIVNAPL